MSIAGDDLRWYGTSIIVSVLGAAVQLAWPNARQLGFGDIVLAIGLFIGLARLLLQRQARATDRLIVRLDGLERALDIAPPDPGQDPGLSSLAVDLWRELEAEHHDRRAGIREGVLAVAGREASVKFLRILTERATRSVIAVDLADVHEWLTSPGMRDYLTFQLDRAARHEIQLERLRIVREADLVDKSHRAQLRQFVEMHDRAEATITLCPADELERLSTVFGAQGMALMDRDHNAACVMGRIGTGGHLEGAVVYLRRSSALRQAAADYDRVIEHVQRTGVNTRLRTLLKL